MNIPASDVKSLLITNGLQDAGVSGDSLEKLAQEISESVRGINDGNALADTIYKSLSASGIGFSNIDSLTEIVEKIAHTISTSPYIE